MAAGAQRFEISDTNPNDQIGGGGCLCSEGKCVDAGGPYVISPHVMMENYLSPHAVECAPCVLAKAEAIKKVMAGGEVLRSSEVVVDATFEEIPTTIIEGPESPTVELEDLPAI